MYTNENLKIMIEKKTFSILFLKNSLMKRNQIWKISLNKSIFQIFQCMYHYWLDNIIKELI